MIVYIHGAHMSSAAFNYIRDKLPEHEFYNVEYSAMADLEDTVARIRRELKLLGKPFKIVAHSLGGAISVRMLQEGLPVEKIVTMSSPLGGIKTPKIGGLGVKKSALSLINIPSIQHFMPNEVVRFSNFVSQLSPESPVFSELHSKPFDKSKLFTIITNFGKGFSTEDNDMVVTVKSQRHFSEAASEEIECSHTEILTRPEAVEIIKREFSMP